MMSVVRRGSTAKALRRTLAVMCLLALVACSTPTGGTTTEPATATTISESPTSSAEGTTTTNAEVVFDVGVTEDEVVFGAITDLTGPFAAQGIASSQGLQLAFDDINAAGGVCGRDLRVEIEDFGFDIQLGVAAYERLEPDVLSIIHTISAPLVNQLSPRLADDSMLTLGTPISTHLGHPYLVVPTTLFSVDLINGLSWFAEEHGLAEGDVLAYIYFEGPVGEDTVEGVTYAANELGLELNSQQVQVTEADLTAQVIAAQEAGASAFIVATSPRQLASIVAVATGIGFDIPILATTFSFDPSLLDTAVKDALESRVDLVGSFGVYSSPDPGPTRVRELFEAQYPDQPRTFGVMNSFSQGILAGEILARACQNRDITRSGMQEALQLLESVDTGGLVPLLDYSQPGRPPANQSYIAEPDAEVDGGMRLAVPYFDTPIGISFVDTIAP
ncbi:MAG: ABC transporter substrate-binding protein [Acidimicrobiia bacterium]